MDVAPYRGQTPHMLWSLPKAKAAYYNFSAAFFIFYTTLYLGSKILINKVQVALDFPIVLPTWSWKFCRNQ